MLVNKVAVGTNNFKTIATIRMIQVEITNGAVNGGNFLPDNFFIIKVDKIEPIVNNKIDGMFNPRKNIEAIPTKTPLKP